MKLILALSFILAAAGVAAAESPARFTWAVAPPSAKFTWAVSPAAPPKTLKDDSAVRVWASPGPTYSPQWYAAPPAYVLPPRYTPPPPPPRVAQPVFRGRASNC